MVIKCEKLLGGETRINSTDIADPRRWALITGTVPLEVWILSLSERSRSPGN